MAKNTQSLRTYRRTRAELDKLQSADNLGVAVAALAKNRAVEPVQIDYDVFINGIGKIPKPGKMSGGQSFKYREALLSEVFSSEPVAVSTIQSIESVLNLNSGDKFIRECIEQGVLLRAVDKTSSIVAVVNQANRFILDLLFPSKKSSKPLSDTDSFETKTEDETVLLHRFVEQRSELLANYEMLDSETACEILGKNPLKDNKARTIKNAIDSNDLIAFKTAGQYMIPAFQFNKKGHILAPLAEQLSVINKCEVDHLDLCFWLTSSRIVTLKAPKLQRSFKGLSYGEAMQLSDEQEANSIIFDGLPIEVAKEGDSKLFSMLVDEWLNTDEYNIFEGKRVNE